MFLVCTEVSGDLLGARLVHELKKTQPNLLIKGVGGEKLLEEGMSPSFRVSDFNVMGLLEVLSQLKRLKRMFNVLVEEVVSSQPQVIVLIDAPDFNLRFAKALKKRQIDIPIIYYVSPQVWAWREKRAAEIARVVDHMMVLFSFEKDIYTRYQLPTTWVGHPLVDELHLAGDAEEFKRQHGLALDKPLVALAPGSRNSEVRRLLPVMAEVVRARADRYQFVIPLANTIPIEEAQALLGDVSVPILPGMMRPIMFHADAAVVASGTATLETGLLRTPMVVGYKMKAASFFVARMLVKVAHVALVNIVLGERVVPELIQKEFCPEKILPELDALVTPGPRRTRVLEAFEQLEPILGGGGAAGRAAAVVARFLDPAEQRGSA